ncbi:MAG: hypothetical protein KJ559_01680 [Nanoarchaeota archaeon]|nr:hypothetical protein [Nanoarchaeota archaeon]
MNEKLRELSNEENYANKGIIISAIIIFGGLLPNIEISSVKIFFPDSILILLVGFTSIIYFMSLKVNQNERYDGKRHIIITTPVYKSLLSKSMYNLSILLFILTLMRIVCLIIKEFI